MAVATNKRLITILYHSVEREKLHSALAEVQWIDYPELGSEQTFERLLKALDTNLEWEHKHTQLLQRAAEWKSKNHDPGFLLHGMEIRDAVRWLEQGLTIKDRKPMELHEQYVRASEEWEAGEIKRLTELTEEKERQRREAERQSRMARARELVASSTLSLQVRKTNSSNWAAGMRIFSLASLRQNNFRWVLTLRLGLVKLEGGVLPETGGEHL